jgi:hypothetical protein
MDEHAPDDRSNADDGREPDGETERFGECR